MGVESVRLSRSVIRIPGWVRPIRDVWFLCVENSRRFHISDIDETETMDSRDGSRLTIAA